MLYERILISRAVEDFLYRGQWQTVADWLTIKVITISQSGFNWPGLQVWCDIIV